MWKIMDIPIVPKVGKLGLKRALGTTSVLIIVVGIFIVGSEVGIIYQQLDTSDWEEIPATVSISEIREYETCGEDGCFSNDYPYIRYSYFVDGESYSNDDIVLFDLDEGDFGFSISLVDQHPKGSEVTAYYNPENPDQAVLMKGFSGVYPLIVFLGEIIIWVYVAVVTFLIVWKILFHIQPAGNRKKAEQKYADDEDDEKRYNMMLMFSSLAFNRAPRIWVIVGSTIFLIFTMMVFGPYRRFDFADSNFPFPILYFLCASTCVLLPLLALFTARSFEKTLPEHSHKRYKLVYDAAAGQGQGGWDSGPEAMELQAMARSAWIKKNFDSMDMDEALNASAWMDSRGKKLEGGARTFSVLIDGSTEKEFQASSVGQLLENIPDSDEFILFLEDTKEKGRQLEFSFLGDKGGDDHLSIKELLGDELIREEIVNVERNPGEIIDFVEETLRNCGTDEEDWWN
tara:strand:+ start:278 stop:1648 length:1371 start_codon:yes stop_codon:yes gene_type:complete